jgi:sulfur carrier protein ThiS
MTKLKVYLEREDKTKTVNIKKPTVENLLKELKINPVTVIVTKNNEVCTEIETLNSKDNIKIISVVSGG